MSKIDIFILPMTPTQARRLDLYKLHRSLKTVAELEKVSRESVRESLEALSGADHDDYKAIAALEKGGRPRIHKDAKTRCRVNSKNWRTRQKSNARSLCSD